MCVVWLFVTVADVSLFCTFLHTHHSFSLTRALNCCFSFSCCSQFSLYFLFVPEASVDGWLVGLTTANHMPLVIVNTASFLVRFIYYVFFFSLFHKKCVCVRACVCFPCLPLFRLLQSSGPLKVPTLLSVPFFSCKKQNK